MSHRISRRRFLQRSLLGAAALPQLPGVLGGCATGNAVRSVHEVDSAAIRKLKTRVQGIVLSPGDKGYERASQLWTGGLPKRPGLVVRCADTRDVAATVKFARKQSLPLAVRGGGHTLNATCDGGVLINLSDMNRITVQPEERRAQVGGGCLNGPIDRTTAPHGLAAVLGECPTVGVAGLGLGGGLGRLMGQHGALCDNLVGAEVVCADGRVRQANSEANSDLFWALRGGSGNFGVVTSLSFRLHPVGQVMAGMLRYPASQARDVLHFLGPFMEQAPDTLDALIEIGSGILQYAPDAREPTVVINVCCGGPLNEAERTLKPLREFLPPARDTIRPMSYFSAQELGDVSSLLATISSGAPGFRRSGFVTRLDKDVIDIILASCERPPSRAWSFALDHYMHGAVCRVPTDAMAFALRQSGFSLRAAAFETEGGDAEKVTAWVKDLTGVLRPFSQGRIYLNYLTDQGELGVRAALGDNYPRLRELKIKYDPDNFFRLNPNIVPG